MAHAMGLADITLSANFSMWFLHCCMEEPQFQRQIFTDECRFTMNAVLISRSSHAWDDENLHPHHAHGFQQSFGINVWAGIVNGRLIRPYLLQPRLKGYT